MYYPKPVTILELAEIVRDVIVKNTNGKVKPQIDILDQGKPLLFPENSKNRIKVDMTKAMELLGLIKFQSPSESIERIIKNLKQ